MSDTAQDYTARLTLAEQVARIERMNVETAKFVAEQQKLAAEQGKLAAEQQKFAAEQGKFAAEERKLDRDRFLAPWTLIVATLGGFAAFFAAGAAFMRSLVAP